MIEPIFVFLGLLFVSILGQAVQAIRMASTKQPFTGQVILSAITLWAVLSFAYQYMKSEAMITVLPIVFSAVSLGLVIVFCQRFLGLHINLPKNQKYLSIISITALMVVPLIPIHPSLRLTIVGFSGVMVSLVVALYIERLYHVLKHNHHHSGLVLGLLGVTISHFIGFCELILSPKINPYHSLWVAAASLLFYPMIYRGVSKLGNVDVKLAISRPMALHATLFSIAGLYLLGLAGVGFFLQNFAPSWTYTSHLTLMVAATFPLIYAMASSKLRREILVWINKHFFSSQFDYRDTWRMLNAQLNPKLNADKAKSQALKTLLEAIDHPRGAYYRLQKKAWRCASSNMKPLSPETEESLFDIINDIQEEAWIIDVAEAKSNPDNYPMIKHTVNGLFESKVHWIIPSVVNDEIVGVWIVAGGEAPKWSLNWETRDYLSSLLQQVESYIDAQEKRQTFQENAQLAAFHQTSAFVIHDMKNVYAQLSMINKNGIKHKSNPEFIDDMFLSLNSMQARMEKMLGQLTNKQRSSEIRIVTISLMELWKSLENDSSLVKHGIQPVFEYRPTIDVTIETNDERFRNVIKHLIDNAQYASKENNTKNVVCRCWNNDNHAIIEIVDGGSGMSEDFLRNKLFKPFETTKGNSGMGLGVYDAKQFAEQMGGEMKVDSDVEKGTKMTLLLPRSGINEFINS